MKNVGIYIHIPFCSSKCGYCSFYSAPPQPGIMAAYTQKIVESINNTPFPYEGADTVYFGGGTPSLIGASLLLNCLDAVNRRYPLVGGCEVTVEANPASLTFEDLRRLRQGGINRLSIGVQSLEDNQLKLLGRRHTAGEAQEAVRLAQKAGFQNISVDLMLGLPGQTLEHICRFAQVFGQLGVSHISAYILKIEEDTPFARQNIEKICPNEDTVADLYLQTVEYLDSLGYRQYEISNFARDGKISRHNTRYWQCQDYLGVGPSAHSFLEGQRYYFNGDTQDFLSHQDIWQHLQSDGDGGDFEEYCMLGLRLTWGLDLREVAHRYPQENTGKILQRAKPYLAHGYMVYTKGRLAFTPQGFLVSNDILAALLL